MKGKESNLKAFTVRVPKSLYNVLRELAFYTDVSINQLISVLLLDEIPKWIKYSKAEEITLEDGSTILDGIPEERQKIMLNEINKARKEIEPIIVPYPVKDEDIMWKD